MVFEYSVEINDEDQFCSPCKHEDVPRIEAKQCVRIHPPEHCIVRRVAMMKMSYIHLNEKDLPLWSYFKAILLTRYVPAVYVMCHPVSPHQIRSWIHCCLESLPCRIHNTEGAELVEGIVRMRVAPTLSCPHLKNIHWSIRRSGIEHGFLFFSFISSKRSPMSSLITIAVQLRVEKKKSKCLV